MIDASRMGVRVVLAGVLAVPAVAQPASEDLTPLPPLDVLLGLEEPGGRDDLEIELPDPSRNQLDRELTNEEASEQFGQAVDLMHDAALRLADGADAGIITQRLQEDVLRKLDQVIAAAEQNQSQGGGSRSPRQRSQQQSQQPSQAQQQSQRADGQSEPTDTNVPSGSTETAFNPADAPDSAAWGRLPARVRDALTQGLSDRYSSMYDRLTREFYRRLAEEEDE